MVALGQLVSLLGTNLTTFALSIWALEQTGQVSEFALINVFGRLPAIVFAPLAGAIADKYDRRLVMIFSDVLAACSTVAVALLFGQILCRSGIFTSPPRLVPFQVHSRNLLTQQP